MPLFAANVSMLFTEVPLLERFERAAEAGFAAVEMQFPYAWPAAAIRDALRASGLTMVLHNLPGGDAAAGDRGIGCNPARVDEFRAGVAVGITCAKTLGVTRVNALAGIAPPGVADAVLRRTFIDNLRHAAAVCADAGLVLLTEPINSRDVPGFWLDTSTKALSVIDEVGADNLLLQYDLYHAQRSEGDLADTLRRHLARIGHIQIADVPGRHEPGSGEIDWRFVLRHLDAIGYAGHVGCEYIPAAGTEAGLGWMAEFR